MIKHRRARQRGAALVLGLAILAVAVLAWRERTSLSQLLMAQQSLDQATAAAALSAAQLQARRLNAHAFLNRTVMAHRVAMAHLLTIASAEKMRLEMSRRVTRGNPPAYLIGMIFGPQHAAAYAASKLSPVGQTQSGIEALHQAFQNHDRTIHHQITTARKALLTDVEPSVQRLVRDVINRNLRARPGTYLPLTIEIRNPAGSLALVKKDPTAEVWRRWFASVMKKHQYLQSRRQTASNYFWINPRCPLMFPQLRRRGGTVLSTDGIWQATDTLSFHKVRGAHWALCYWREYPMGWANVKQTVRRADSSRHDQRLEQIGAMPDNFSSQTFLRWALSSHAIGHVLTGMNNLLGDGWALSSQVRWRSRKPVQAFVLRAEPDIATTVRVTQPLQTLDASALHLGLRLKGLIQTREKWGQHLSASAAAQAYYDRYGPRPDHKQETPNLFQPFWMARQVPVTP